MAIGGKGASGNVGGNVTVTNRNAIETYGVGACVIGNGQVYKVEH